VKQICELIKCGKSQVYNILKQKNEIKEQWMNGKLNYKSKYKIQNSRHVWFTF